MTKIEQAAAVVAAARATFADADSLAASTRQEVVDLLALTAELTRIVDAQRVRLAGEIAERSKGPDDASICRLLGTLRPRDTIAAAFGIRSSEASHLLTLAAATTGTTSLTGEDIAIKYPRVAAALDDGELSIAQARAIVGTLEPAAPRADLTQLAWAEGCLVDAATDADAPLVPELLVTQANAYVAVLDPDGVLPNSERQRALRSLRVWQRPDGAWRFNGCSPAAEGSTLKAFLDASTSPRVDVTFRDDEGDARDSERGGAGADIDERPVDDRTPAQKRHDALIAVVQAHVASGGAPLAGGEVPRLVFNGSIEAFDAYVHGIDHPDRSLTVEHTGSVVPIETVDRLLCDAVVQRAVVDAAGHVLDLGREQRLFTRAQRRALAVQYGGCATPGCRMPVAWTEAHHVTWWQHGGPTDVGNGILLCSHCHHEVHAHRLLVVGSTGDWRVIAQLRPTDRYARNRRTGGAPRTIAARTASTRTTGTGAAGPPVADLRTAGPRTTVAHAARAPLALALTLTLPDTTSRRSRCAAGPTPRGDHAPSGAGRDPGARRARRPAGMIEHRLTQRLAAGYRARQRMPAMDRHPAQQVVMRM